MEKSVLNQEEKGDLSTANKNIPPDADVACEPKEKKRTWGNVIYDFGVFGSVAWVGVAALSAISAHESMHGKHKAFGWLRTLNDKAYGGLKNIFSKTVLKGAKPEVIDGYAKGTTMFLTLGMGGNALMAPIKWLEDNRQKNAARIDNMLGTTPPDPETIAAEPHQTWKSVFSGRLLSWGGSYAAFIAMGPKLTSAISEKFGKLATEGYLSVSPKSNPKTVRKWADIAAFDALFTMITASATYLLSRAIATSDDKKIHDVEEALYSANITAPTYFEDKPVPSHTAKFCPPEANFKERVQRAAEAQTSLAI